MHPPLSVAITQPAMRASIAENLPRLCDWVSTAAASGSSLVVFPECATTGLHRHLAAACQPLAIIEAMQTLDRLCQQHRIGVVVGSPWRHDGVMLNAAIVLRPGCPPLIAPKVGLTPSELRFFSPGLRTPPWRLGPWRLATILCREVEDIDALVAAYAGRVDALIWPGYMAWSGDNDTDDSVALALRLGVPVLQCNWPGSLNAPGQHRMGESRFTLADGTTAAVGPSGVGQVCWQLPLPQGD